MFPPTVNTHEQFTAKNVSILPNPATDYLELQFAEGLNLQSVTFLTTDGKIIEQVQNPTPYLALDFEYKGLLFVQLHFAEGKTTRKLMKL